MGTETEVEGCGHKPKDASRHQELKEAGKILSWIPQRDILDCERMNCGLKSMVCGHWHRGPGTLAQAAAQSLPWGGLTPPGRPEPTRTLQAPPPHPRCCPREVRVGG